MRDATRNLRSRVLDRFGEREPVGQTGQAVAQHLGTKRSLGLNFDGTVDDAEQAALDLALVRQRGELQAEELRGDALALLQVEFAIGVVTVEEPLDQFPNRAALQAVGLIPIGGGAGGSLDRVDEFVVMSGDSQNPVARSLAERP